MSGTAIIRTLTTPITVTTAGTRVQVSSTEIQVSSIIFQADPDNTGKVYIGDSNVTSTNGIALDADETYEIAMDVQWGNPIWFDLRNFYIDSAENGDVVRVSYIKYFLYDQLT